MGIDFDILEHCRKVRRNRIAKVKAPPILNVPEPLTSEEAQKMVQFEINGVACRWNITEPLDVVSKEDFSDDDAPVKVEQQESLPQLPVASFKDLEDYNICDAPPRPNAYIRFIEKSTEELDGEVEYDVDEEDTAWLALTNQKREAAGLAPVSVDSLELLMDRLEKESYFQASVNGHTGAVVGDDAVAAYAWTANVRIPTLFSFCDMCNLAVHQDCYGVPYIPEGQWLCRSYRVSAECVCSPPVGPSTVYCVQIRRSFSNRLIVACGLMLYVPFGYQKSDLPILYFLEPIDSIETIPAARWKLTCYVCKQKGVGACIQCHKNSCYSAFHVTCAQQAGLYMKMDTVKDGGDSQPVLVQKIAYCDAHAPAENSDAKKDDSRKKMIQARKMLAKKRTSAPVILIPTIPPERIQEIGSLVTITKKSQFIQRLIAYWTLKRQFRNGVPLLRRLQSSQGGSRDSNTSNVDTIELCRQLKYWQCLRQDLERARLLCELVRKREKVKLEFMKISQKCLNIKLKPLEASLRKVLDLIQAKDTNEIFSEPVDLEEVPDYTTVVTEPMDLTAMEKDFDLMIANCLAYNNRDTVFYRAGIKMRDQCAVIFRQAKKDLDGGAPQHRKRGTGAKFFQCSLLLIFKGKTGPEVLIKLEDLLAKSQALKHGLAEQKVKLIRSELAKAKKNVAQHTDTEHTSQSDGDGENDSMDVKNSPSSSSCFKKEDKDKEDKEPSPPPIKQKRKGKSRHAAESTPNRVSKERDNVPDSFKVYRAGNQTSDDNSDSDNSLSTCYSHSLSEIDSDEDSECSNSTALSAADAADGPVTEKELKPLQLVWAKCRGYPWYPALIIDSQMPKGYVHKGVPIPSPPQEVLDLLSNYTDQVFLVLFFDAKRTWQWLPAEKLEILGIDIERDEAKVNESRKPADRKAVKRRTKMHFIISPRSVTCRVTTWYSVCLNFNFQMGLIEVGPLIDFIPGY
ncbi:hypothetical protein NQ317_010555 [Molorchus minor]|uniref:Peregrin n=1 Tax=Molorchus minor TaxID=1323400 RepID=A0ABQ9ISZ9_9CUCU|nr:hypothetical protein NQ317_010555 [Molorchus minor]